MTHYERLGLTPGASVDEIKAAYRRLAMANHPDRHGGDNDQFLLVKHSYDCIMRKINSVGLFDDIIEEIAKEGRR